VTVEGSPDESIQAPVPVPLAGAGAAPARIIVHISSRAEWHAVLALLPTPESMLQSPVGAFFDYTWLLPGETVPAVVLHGGAGTISAAASTQYALLTWRPNLYVVLGTCGAVDPTLGELDIVLGTRTVVYDVDSAAMRASLTIELPGGWESVRFPFPVRTGLIATGDQDIRPANVEGLRSRFSPLVADWESGAVAKICAMNDTPCLILRGVSDVPLGSYEEQSERYRENTPEVMRRLWQNLTACLEHRGSPGIE